jgi:ABC-type glycerol-3-phosphate transport system permease component
MSTTIAIIGAYSVSRFKFKGKNFISFLMLFSQMLPIILLVLPLYVIFAKLHLTNTLYSLIIFNTALTIPLGMFFLKGFYDSIPRELDEAATIDGCSKIGILFRVILPILKPGIIATGTWSFIVAWDEFLFAYTLIDSDKLQTVSIGLARYFGQYDTPWNLLMAGSVLGTLFPLLLFLFFQRYLVSGLTAGSVKG